MNQWLVLFGAKVQEAGETCLSSSGLAGNDRTRPKTVSLDVLSDAFQPKLPLYTLGSIPLSQTGGQVGRHEG